MVPDISLRAGVPRPVSGLGTSFLLLCLFGFEVLRGSRASFDWGSGRYFVFNSSNNYVYKIKG